MKYVAAEIIKHEVKNIMNQRMTKILIGGTAGSVSGEGK
jgi:hypothetical protein